MAENRRQVSNDFSGEGGSGARSGEHGIWEESLALRAEQAYLQQREALAEGKPVAIRLEGKLLLLTPRQPGHPAPESGEVPVVEALIADILDVRSAIHPEQALRLLVEELSGGKSPEAPEAAKTPYTQE